MDAELNKGAAENTQELRVNKCIVKMLRIELM